MMSSILFAYLQSIVSLGRCLLGYFVHFLNWVVCFLTVELQEFFLYPRLLSEMCFERFFSQGYFKH